MPNSSKFLGIDLGTTFTVVAHLDAARRPKLLAAPDGSTLIPSAVLATDGNIRAGHAAFLGAFDAPQSYADYFKRNMGDRYFPTPINGVPVPPEVLSAFVLEYVKNLASQSLGEISGAVITVPAFFDEARRQATKKAGQLAGFRVLDILNEPTAAALAVGSGYSQQTLPRKSADQPVNILIYDLGGGTFDVTILRASRGEYRVLATDGDTLLGGRDFTERVADSIAQDCLARYGIDPREDEQGARCLWEEANQVKHVLASEMEAFGVVRYAGFCLESGLTRIKFEELTADLLMRTELTTRLVLEQAGLTDADIAVVIAVGGASRMPAVGDMLTRTFGSRVVIAGEADTLVAQGAALHAAQLGAQEVTGEPASPERLINVAPHSLGVVGREKATGRRAIQIVIPKNSTLPCQETRRFWTSKPAQKNIAISVVEGESSVPDECIVLGTCVVDRLPQGLPANTGIDVAFKYASDGTLEVTARIPSIRRTTVARMQRTTDLENEDLAAWRARLTRADSSLPHDASGAVLETGSLFDVIGCLDSLYRQLGEQLLRNPLPRQLERTAKLLSAAMKDRKQLIRLVDQIVGESFSTSAQQIHHQRRVVQRQRKLEETERRIKFLTLVLGRDAVDQGVVPPGSTASLAAIERAKRRIEQLSHGVRKA